MLHKSTYPLSRRRVHNIYYLALFKKRSTVIRREVSNVGLLPTLVRPTRVQV